MLLTSTRNASPDNEHDFQILKHIYRQDPYIWVPSWDDNTVLRLLTCSICAENIIFWMS